MVTSNKKLIKNFRDILAASINAKGLINAEIEKVDAKYAALAEKEKADYNKQLKALDVQIEMCNDFLNGADTSVSDKKEEVEEKVVDKEAVAEPEKPSDELPFVEEAVEETPAETPAEEPVQEEETVVEDPELGHPEPAGEEPQGEDDDWGFGDKEW